MTALTSLDLRLRCVGLHALMHARDPRMQRSQALAERITRALADVDTTDVTAVLMAVGEVMEQAWWMTTDRRGCEQAFAAAVQLAALTHARTTPTSGATP